MWAFLEDARAWVRSLWPVGRPKASPTSLAEVEAADPTGDDHHLLRLLRRALLAGDDAAADRALVRLAAHYREVGAWEKAVAVLTQQVARHPDDEGAKADLEAAHLALGHRGDAARVAPRSSRGRMEVVHVPPEDTHPTEEGLDDTLPLRPPDAAALGIDDADTDLDVVPRHQDVPGDATAPVDKKMLDLLLRLSS